MMGAGEEWSQEELNYLRINYKQGSAKDIAEKLNRPVKGVKTKAQRMGLCRKNEKTNGVYQESVSKALEEHGREKMKSFSLDIKIGDKLVVTTKERESSRYKLSGKIRGVVTHKDRYKFTIKTENYPISVTLSELHCGDVKIIERECVQC